MSYNYGLTKKELFLIQEKIDNQLDFLEQNSITTSKGDKKTFLDMSFSANHSKRYYPRILNRVETFTAINFNKGYVPLFLTCTLDGFFRDFLKGDYSRWNKNKDKYIKGNHIPNNSRNGYYLDLIKSEPKLTPKDLYKILGHQLHLFTKALSGIKKDNEDFSYSFLRVAEPHKDGVPHFHILMYVPLEYVPQVYKAFMRNFPAPRNSERLTLYNTQGKHRRAGKKIAEGMYETHGFQTEVYSPIGYILKYILKSFSNLIKGDDLDYLQAWYIKHRIPRLISTHTLVSQDVYTKIAPLEEDWYYLSNIKIDGDFIKSKESNYFKFKDSDRSIIGNNGYFSIINNGKVVSTYGSYNYDALLPFLKTMKFTSVRPKIFNPFLNYAAFNIYDTLRKKYEYDIVINASGDTFISFTNQNDFMMRIADSDYFIIDDENYSFDLCSGSFLEIAKDRLDIQTSIYNSLIRDGDLEGVYFTQRDYFFNELWGNTYDDTDYSLSFDCEETQEDMINEIFQNYR